MSRAIGLYRVAVELVRSKCKVDVETSDYVEVSDYARNRSKTRDYGPRACSVLSPVMDRLCLVMEISKKQLTANQTAVTVRISYIMSAVICG